VAMTVTSFSALAQFDRRARVYGGPRLLTREAGTALRSAVRCPVPVCACARLSEMTGKCLLCGFDLEPDDEGNKRTGSHSRLTCALKSYPCQHRLPRTHPFHKSGTCYSKDCACLEKCSKCRGEGHHVGAMALSPERFVMDRRTENITRRRGAPPLTISDFSCTWLQESDVAEWVQVQHAACWQKLREAQELTASAARLAANVHEVGWDVLEATNVMEASGVAAATNGVENRAHFKAMVASAIEPGQTAVGAAIVATTGGAAAVVRAEGGRAGREGHRAAAGRARIGRGGVGAAAEPGSGRGQGAAAGGYTVDVGQRGGAAAANPPPISPVAGNEELDLEAVAARRSAEPAWDRHVRGRSDVRGGRVGRCGRRAAATVSTQSGRTRRALRRGARRSATTAVAARPRFLREAHAVVLWRRWERAPPHRCSGSTLILCTLTRCGLPMACRACLLRATGRRTGSSLGRRPRRALAPTKTRLLALPPLLTLRPFIFGGRQGNVASMQG